jgi:hypothetical protein
MGKSTPKIPHLDKSRGCTQLIVNGKPFVMLGGELQNSSASDLAFMEPIWDRMVSLNSNTVLAPIYWECLEPEEGHFDFTLVNGLLKGAREHNLKLVLLWFGTWKNGESAYVPRWVKTDLKRFPRVQTEPGVNSRTITPLSDEGCKADAKAFRELMKFLKKADGEQHTVIMVQVENETGVLGASRDMSSAAEKLFNAPIPRELTKYLKERTAQMVPGFRSFWEGIGAKTSGTWPEVFQSKASETFMAWQIAAYIDKVAAAGKAEYALPMYVNTWLPYGQKPGQYPSGGPTAEMIGIWQAGAPNIDFIAPDIYHPDFRMCCADFTQAGNPLMIPEANVVGGDANAFWAIAEHNAICFAPFGVDSPHPWGSPWDSPRLAPAYKFLTELMPLITAHQGTGKMKGVLQQGGESSYSIELGKYKLNITYNRKADDTRGPGHGLVINTAADEYLVAGTGFTISFEAKPGEPRNVDFISVDEGWYVDGEWKPGRRMNGDDTVGAKFGFVYGTELALRRAKLYSYA